jgi:translation initiation factor IF-2
LSNPQTREKTDKPSKDKKVRVFALAKELNLESKVLVDLCKELGFTGITSQLNVLEPEQTEALKERVKKGPKSTVAASTPAPVPTKPVIPPTKPDKIINLPKAKPSAKPVTVETAATPATEPAAAAEQPAQPAQPTPPTQPTVTIEATAPASTAGPATDSAVVAQPPATEPTPTASPAPTTVPPTAGPPAPPQNIIPTVPTSGIRNLSAVRNLSAGSRPSGAPARPTPPTQPAPPAPATPKMEQPPPQAPPKVEQAPAAGPATSPPASRPTQPPGPPPNIIPPTIPPTGRPAVLNRPPQVAPPKFIAGPRTGSSSSASGNPPRPGPTGGPPRPGPAGPPGGSRPATPPARPLTQGGKPVQGQPMKLTPEMIERLRNASARGQRMSLDQLAKPQPVPPPGSTRGSESRSGQGSASRIAGRPQHPVDIGDDEDEKKKSGPGGVIGRDSRHKGRQDKGRQSGPRVDRSSIVIGAGGVETIDERFGSRRGPRAALLRKARRGQQQQTVVKEGKIEIALPITVRSLSETIGMKAAEVTKRLLKETNQLYGINSTIDFDTASLIALEKNIELVAKKQETKEDILLERYRKLLEDVDPAKLKPRPPIVTIMGHVDHGKTSLLDRIRQNYGIESDVVSSEAGGITQVIRAWSVKRDVIVEKDGQDVTEERRITFLDTPGHEAFTKMRARGANVTDIAVIVVAATDGVMPQTQEAISHAKAADVHIIVAINKVDMPNANVERTRRQLYNEGLLPDDMGGDVQFVETSAVTGQGIAELLDTIVLVAEVAELKADPDRPAAGTCLEAYMSSDEGVMATVLIQQGTLKRGDIVLCGSAYGRVRAMYNDMGTPIKEAGPSTPVRITGLNRVPNADDPFYVVEELAEAQEIAEAREQKEREAMLVKRGPQSLDSLKEASSKAKITELKIILKAEARGSVEAIRKELEKLTHDEVRTRVLHAGVGAITESDVQLALTSPEDTLVIGFNVTADDAALKLAEERGISLREYDIIYKLTDDVKAALEGRLKPVEEVIHLGRAVVRDTFKISKVGTIAGCYVTSGTIERNARVRVIRQGVVVYPPSDKVVGLDSLKRFKDDVKEVREGFECGIKISGFDDVKIDDVIEAFKIETRQRTL